MADEFKLEDLPLVKLNEDGTVTCRNCAKVIQFLPPSFPADQLPDGAPRSVNHTGCPNAKADESPAGPDAESGRHETINRIDPEEVKAYYERVAAATK